MGEAGRTAAKERAVGDEDRGQAGGRVPEGAGSWRPL